MVHLHVGWWQAQQKHQANGGVSSERLPTNPRQKNVKLELEDIHVNRDVMINVEQGKGTGEHITPDSHVSRWLAFFRTKWHGLQQLQQSSLSTAHYYS